MNKNLVVAALLALVALGMGVFGYAMVPLYRIFCDAVGIAVPTVLVGKEGEIKPRLGAAASSPRAVTVRFMANASADMPVRLKALERSLPVITGDTVLTAYEARNPSAQTITGTAVHTIVPVGSAFGVNIDEYIELQQCFCFEEQLYPAGKDVNLPLSFTVLPTLPEGIHTITFAYTLYPIETAPKREEKAL